VLQSTGIASTATWCRQHSSAFVSIRQYTSAFVDATAREECDDTQRTVEALLRRC
jgi:hypothetical protein